MRLRPSAPARARQRGLSPVEIMVGLVISLLVIGGLSFLVTGTRETGRVERNLLQMQESGRIAVEMLGRELRKSGFRTERVLAPELLFPVLAPFTAAGAVLAGGSNTITERYVSAGDAWTRNCLGTSITAGNMIVQTISVAGGELRCRAQDLTAGTDVTQAMLPGIEAIQFLYGVDTDGDAFADSYVAAGAVANWAAVASIDVRVRTVSAEDNLTPSAQPYRDFDGTVVTPTDRRLRRTYSTVVALRNQLP